MKETSARHDAPATPSELVEERQADMDAADRAGKEEVRPEPIRNVGKHVGRNDPCPCGSGKKFKSCCGKRNV